MSKYSVNKLERHWQFCHQEFERLSKDLHYAFSEMIAVISDLLEVLNGTKTLEGNCSYLLLARGFNHIASAYLLLQRGLMTDAILTSRSAIETFLQLELFLRDRELCAKWAEGRRFKPGEVRKKLAAMEPLKVGDVVVEVPASEYDEEKSSYEWLSRNAHANRESMDHLGASVGPNEYLVDIGGKPSFPLAVDITRRVSNAYTRCTAICVVVYQMPNQDELLRRLQRLSKVIGKL